MSKESQGKIIVFQEKQIRRTWYNDEWYFSVLDVVGLLAETDNPTDYFKKMRKRDEQLKSYVGTNCPHVALEGKTGKKRNTLVGNTKTIFRIIQSIPSPKAEPFKQWLAKVGYERVQEIENPELAAQRMRQLYKDKGYSDEWIELRMQSMGVRNQLTGQWDERGIEQGKEYAILTAEIARATFGLNPKDHKSIKGLGRENLRDHMTNLELIFTMLGEESTRQKIIETDAQGFQENKQAAKKGGAAAGDALDAYEKSTGQKVVSSDNYLQQIQDAKQPKLIDPTEEE